jgi:hypothetical protein
MLQPSGLTDVGTKCKHFHICGTAGANRGKGWTGEPLGISDCRFQKMQVFVLFPVSSARVSLDMESRDARNFRTSGVCLCFVDCEPVVRCFHAEGKSPQSENL